MSPIFKLGIVVGVSFAMVGCGAEDANQDALLPVLTPHSYSTNEDQPLNSKLTATSIEGSYLDYSMVSATSNGALELSQDGTFSYTPSLNYYGEDSFTASVSDGLVISEEVNFTIQVVAINDSPVLSSTTYTVNEDQLLQGQLTAVDIEGDNLIFSVVSTASNGALELSEDGIFSYSPAANFSGEDSFTARASDGSLFSEDVNFTIQVAAINDSPFLDSATYTGTEDQLLKGQLTAVDIESDNLIFSVVSTTHNGSLELSQDGVFTYNPVGNYFGEDSFTARVGDGFTFSAETNFKIQVGAVNDLPVLGTATFTVSEDQSLQGQLTGVDIEGDSLMFSVVSTTSNGALELSEDGAFSYSPTVNFAGEDKFTARASDGALLSEDVNFTIQVAAINDSPVLESTTYTATEDQLLQGQLTAVDIEGGNLIFSVVSTTTTGSLELSEDGMFSYSPAANFSGEDSFTARVSDGSLFSDNVNFTIQVAAINDAPVLNSAIYTVSEDQLLQNRLTAVDIEGDSLTFSVVSTTSNGSLELSEDGVFSYSPAANFFGEDSFTARTSDGSLLSEDVNFTIQVAAKNDSPVLVSATYTATEDQLLQGQLTAVDIEGDNLIFAVVSTSSNGSLELSEDGMFSYSPAANFSGEDSFTARVNDGENYSDELSFTIQIQGINDAPTVQPISMVTRLDQPKTALIEASDADGDFLTYRIVSQPNNGVASLTEGNLVSYTPNVDSIGVDSFEVEVSDQQLSATTIVTIENNLSFKGVVTGNAPDNVDVVLTGNGKLIHAKPDSEGGFKFYGLADGGYSVKARSKGYKSSPAKAFNLNIENPINEEPEFLLELLDGTKFSYHWEEDQSTAGTDYAASVNQPVLVSFLEEDVMVVDETSAIKLQHDFNILLVDSDTGEWKQEHAYRLLEIMKTIPQLIRDPYKEQTLKPSKWEVTSDFIEDDIQITDTDGFKSVLVSEAAFVNAQPKLAEIDGKRGTFYSQRLHHALVRFVTNNGTDVSAYEKILNERYSVSTIIPDYIALTSSTTSEDAGRFQSFHAEEIVQIINMFEEMPVGMHKLPELKYLVRRLDGTPHPLYFSAPAVAWSSLSNGYIEFMETAFTGSSVEHMHRLIIHEKSHFLWAHQFDDQLKFDWIELGGWYQDGDDWYTTNQTEFVSAYAHLKNPNEDMAESISYFVINPDLLKSRALVKYEFIRDRIMQGSIYLSQIRDDLTFDVYNLYPDYVFPGKIKRVDISVDGAPNEDKTVNIEIELHALNVELEGAKNAYLRIFSDIGTYVEVYLYAVDENGYRVEQGTLLSGSFNLSRYAKNGYWRPSQVVITDLVGNKRMEGANDFGWKLYIDNPLEDLIAPEYVENTASLSKTIGILEGQEVQYIHAQWEVNENRAMKSSWPCYASMNDELLSTYRVQEYGVYDSALGVCKVDFIMPHYMPSSNYSMNYIKIIDEALNPKGVYFSNSGVGLRDENINIDEAPQVISLTTENQDIELPELDINDIAIIAIPTNPDNPNGETQVTITFKVRDNISGYRIASLYLRDPQGIAHHYWAYNEGTWSVFPSNDPTQWHTYTRNIILPPGSAPGTWGLSEMTIYDRAGNFNGYDFTEIIHFDVD